MAGRDDGCRSEGSANAARIAGSRLKERPGRRRHTQQLAEGDSRRVGEKCETAPGRGCDASRRRGEMRRGWEKRETQRKGTEREVRVEREGHHFTISCARPKPAHGCRAPLSACCWRTGRIEDPAVSGPWLARRAVVSLHSALSCI